MNKKSVAHLLTSIRNLHKYLFINYDFSNPADNLTVKVTRDHLPNFLNEEEMNLLLSSFDDNGKIRKIEKKKDDKGNEYNSITGQTINH